MADNSVKNMRKCDTLLDSHCFGRIYKTQRDLPKQISVVDTLTTIQLARNPIQFLSLAMPDASLISC